MSKNSAAARIAFLLVCSLSLTLSLLAQKKVQPKPIRFQGAPQYTQQELLAAAGLKPDARLSPTELKARGKQLNDTGLFDVVRLAANAKGVLFTLTPASQLYPLHMENLPLTPGKDLDNKLHDRFPLYRGQLPATGSIVDGVSRTFEEMLAAKGIKATVKATLTSGLGPQKITAVNFAIVSPAVHIGRIQLSGVSAPMQAKAGLVAAGQTGNGFDTEGSAIGLQHALLDLYQDQGYAAVEVDVAQPDAPIVSNQSVDIPFTVAIREGGIYKLGTIDLPANSLVARADVEKTLAKYPAGSGRPLDLYLLAVRDAYHASGYLETSAVSHPSYNEATHIVNYSLEITPGPQYRLAAVKFDGAPDPMAARLKLAWKLTPGSVFDESYVANFTALVQKKDKQLTKWIPTVIVTYNLDPDPSTQKVNCTFHFAKPVQGAK